ncbi:MAG: hypothetical protein DMF42_09550 [Verrucomicrobia bacterium]|nr:MAG: hypothetical protein DMF42_09550 [Verrucomicrobiota bacterium]
MAWALGRDGSITSQVGDYISEFRQTSFYFRRVGEASADAPPNPSHAAGKRQLIFQRSNHTCIFVRVQKVKGERQPLAGGNDCQDVEQENEQIIGVPRFGPKRFLVNQLKVDQPRPASFLVIDNIRHRRIAVRPGAAKFIAPE